MNPGTEPLLSVLLADVPGSMRLHERLGFVHCGAIAGSGYKHGRWLDTVLMQLAINGGTDAPPDPDSLPERRFNATR